MKTTFKYSFFYYLTACLLTSGVILLILQGMKWPVSAEIIIGVALFLHGLLLARSVKDLFVKAQQNGLIEELFLQLQHGFEMSKSKSESDA
jgi:uncharacterized membrane protein YjjP (DUF1212 family)